MKIRNKTKKLRESLVRIIPKLKPVIALIVFYLGLSFLTSSAVLADSFYDHGGDPFYCAVGAAFGIQYSSLGNSVNYNPAQVQGSSSGSMQNASVSSVTGLNAFYGDRFDTMRQVAVPPNSNVEVGFWVWNLAGHNVNVPRVDLFTSKSDPSQGDLTRLGATGNYGTVCDNVGQCRSGKFVSLGNQGGYGNDPSGNSKGKVIYSFTTIQPLQEVSYVATPIWNSSNLSIKYDLTLKNTSTYNVGNIRVLDNLPSGATFDQTFSFNAGETKTISYTDNLGTNYPSSISNNAKIFDNNTYTETNARAKNGSQEINFDTQAGLVWRDDSNSPPGWSAAQDSWSSTNFPALTVSIIPYNFNSSSATVDLSPNIQISKTVSDTDETNVTTSTSHNREALTYNISISNAGGRVTGFNLIDDYNQGLLNITNNGGGTDNTDTITWSNLTLEHSQSLSFTIKAKIKDLIQGTYVINNVVSTTIPNSPTATAISNVDTKAQVTLDKKVTDSDEIKVKEDSVQGDTPDETLRKLTFTINYTNSGDATAHNAVLTDDLTQFVNQNLLNKVENISNGGTYDVTTHQITWIIGDLIYSTNGSVTFDIILNREASQNLDIQNLAKINTSESGDIKDTTLTHVLTPKLQISKTDGKTIVNPGDSLTYTVTVHNAGTGNAYNLKIQDILPDYVSLDTNSISGGGIFDNNKTITWNNTTDTNGIELDVNKDLVLTYKVAIPMIMPGGTKTLTNKVTVSSILIGEIQATDTTDVLTPIISLEKKQDLPANVAPGQPIVYTLTYKNTGTGLSPNTTLVDTVPDHTIFVDFEGSPIQGVYDSTNKTVTWNLGTILPNTTASVSFRVVIEIPTPSGTEIRNTAVIYSPVIEQVNSEVVTATSSACCLGGFIWDDNNKNGIFDQNEFGIANVRVNIKWDSSTYLPSNNVDVYTDSNGHWDYVGLPYFTPLTITTFKPLGYDQITTGESYRIALLPPQSNGVNQDYTQNGIHYITANGCINFLNAGIFRDIIIANTGDSIFIPIFLSISLIALGGTIFILLFKKKKS